MGTSYRADAHQHRYSPRADALNSITKLYSIYLKVIFMKDSRDLRYERGQLADEMKAILDSAEANGRDLTPAEQKQFDSLNLKQSALQKQIERLEISNGLQVEINTPPANLGRRTNPVNDPDIMLHDTGQTWVNAKTGEPIRVYGKGDKLPVSRNKGPGLGAIIRGMFLGSRGDLAVQNALSVGTDSAGGYHVPQHLVADVIEAMRNRSRVMEAGAQMVLLDAATVKVARIATEPTPAWRAEAGTVSESQPTFDQVVFAPKSVDLLIKASLEILEDAYNMNELILDLLGKAIGLELDRAALFGTGASNQPTGLWNQANVLAVDLGTNGDTLEQADLRAALALLSANNAPPPTAAIMAPRTYYEIDAWTDTTDQPLQLSRALQAVPFLETNQVPINQTKGTATNASTILMGDYSYMLIGVRTSLDLQIASELFRETGQVGFFARARYDVQLLQPKAFCKIAGIIP